MAPLPRRRLAPCRALSLLVGLLAASFAFSSLQPGSSFLVLTASGFVAKFVPVAVVPTESGSGRGEQCFDPGFLINGAHGNLSSCKDRAIVSQQCYLGVFNLVRG